MTRNSCHVISFFFLVFVLMSCSVLKKTYTPFKKYDSTSLKKDYDVFRNIIERKHPSLYWYVSKPYMDSVFDTYRNNITDSLTDQEFLWHILSPVAHEVRCGHTTVRKSKIRERWEKKAKLSMFPLSLKLWNDTLAVVRALSNSDTLLKRGFIIKSIDGVSDTEMIRTMKQSLSLDGYADNVNTVRISNNFPLLHRYIFGLRKKYQVEYLDLNGERKTDSVACYDPMKKDSLSKKRLKTQKTQVAKSKGRNEKHRKFSVDSTGTYAILSVNTFSNGQLRRFFRKSFKEIEERKIEHVVIDIRSNGGGKVSLSTLLTKYVSRVPFKVADSVYSTSRTLRPFWRHTQYAILNEAFFYMLSYRKKGMRHHISRLENKTYKPKEKHHYSGNLYILTHGPTFSASTLFCNVLKGQEKVKLIGEESGGGWYGNSGIIIPDFILPNTKLRLRMPLFRVVQSKHAPDRFGKGVPPDVQVGYSMDALLKGRDLKMEKVIELIKTTNQ
ncbi:MAG: hypothetical protein RIR96_153 [Bacteroidota bacterium]